ncbi:hypothetical protein E2C01_037869 [Portunus trituberculatus]|uniref:Uncharacterized protein n=1 Tax=Portunus trituberculatus TaxID=210409 RepID=A0A5B7FGF9_PORTR|nr:hypothetical protein [Portunus trituberculatus]
MRGDVHGAGGGGEQWRGVNGVHGGGRAAKTWKERGERKLEQRKATLKGKCHCSRCGCKQHPPLLSTFLFPYSSLATPLYIHALSLRSGPPDLNPSLTQLHSMS